MLFAGAYALPRRILIRNASHIALLGGVAVLTGTAMTAVAARYALPYGWTWPEALLFGAIAAATDPVAAVALLKEVKPFCNDTEIDTQLRSMGLGQSKRRGQRSLPSADANAADRRHSRILTYRLFGCS